MQTFDDKYLLSELRSISGLGLVAFAAAAATRQLENYERYASRHDSENIETLRKATNHLWSILNGSSVDRGAWQKCLTDVMALLPEEEDGWSIDHSLADDAISSFAYAIRTLLTEDPQEAVWAAQRSYDAADQAAIKVLNAETGTIKAEELIGSSEIVQREIARQNEDIALLKTGNIDEVKKRAYEKGLLNTEDANLISKLS